MAGRRHSLPFSHGDQRRGASGTTAGGGESAHLLEVAGVALLWLLAKREEEATAAHPVLAR